MAQAKKPTNKARDEQIGWLTQQVTNLNRLLGSYIEWKGDSGEFQKHIIDIGEKFKKEQEKKKNDTEVSDTGSNKGNSKTI